MDQPVERKRLLGEKAQHGQVGYTGRAFAPAKETYLGIDPAHLAYTTTEDSGAYPRGKALANLQPLIAAALYEVAFACEAGPLDTWKN